MPAHSPSRLSRVGSPPLTSATGPFMEGRLPTTGEEYLRMVREQAKTYPTVLVAQASNEVKSAKNTSAKYRTDWQSIAPAPEGCAPSKAWQEEFLTQYEQDRKRLAAYRDRKNLPRSNGPGVAESLSHGRDSNKPRASSDPAARDPGDDPIDHLSGTKEQQMGSEESGPSGRNNDARPQGPKKLPRTGDVQGWYRLLYGGTAEEQKEGPGSQPSPALLMRLHQGQVVQLLHYHAKWLSSDNLSDHEGQWLYALFLRIDPLVESDEVSILRSVAKKCAQIRSHMTRESGSKLASVNMVITLVARVYGQTDLLS